MHCKLNILFYFIYHSLAFVHHLRLTLKYNHMYQMGISSQLIRHVFLIFYQLKSHQETRQVLGTQYLCLGQFFLPYILARHFQTTQEQQVHTYYHAKWLYDKIEQVRSYFLPNYIQNSDK
jgi:hypothetical protein